MKITFFVIILCVSVALFAAPRPYSLEPIATLLPGTGFHGDAGFEVIDWNDDEKPDLFVYDTGSVGTGWIYLNEGSLSKPRFTHGFAFPYNITETTPQTIEHLSSRAFCDLNHDGLVDFIFFDGQLRYCPNTGTKHGPVLWSLWPQPPSFFPGTRRMIRENTRYSTGPESIYWNKGIFPRQVLTLTVVDWDGDGLEDLLICRTRSDAPGVRSLGAEEKWTNWGRVAEKIPKKKRPSNSDTKYIKPLTQAPARGLYFYKNIGTKDHPIFDRGNEVRTRDGRSIVSPNPVAIDVDGDGVLDLVSTETTYSSNAFRVDWPTAPHVVWFRRPTAADPTHLEPAAPLRDRANNPIPAGTLARFADMHGGHVADLLVSDPGYTGTIRWYRNAATSSRQKLDLQPPVILSADDFGRFDFMDQPLVVDWFGPNSRDLIMHGVVDPHCKWGLRRTALYKNVAKNPGEIRYEFVGLLNFNGDAAMVPVSAEERPYDAYGSAVTVARDREGNLHVMMSVGGNLFYFSDVARDGLTFRKMQRIPINTNNNRQSGWQEITVDAAQKIQFIRISNDPRGMAHLSDGLLHVLRFEVIADGKNVATAASGVKADRFNVDEQKTHPLDRAMNMFTSDNANTDDELKATTFGLNDNAVITLGAPVKLDKIRFLLSGRDSNWYRKLVPFSWQGETYRAGYEEGQTWYQYKVEVSTDGSSWTTIVDRTKTEILYSHPILVDWDADGKLDLLLYYTSSEGIFPSTKSLKLYRNIGTDADPAYAAPIEATDEDGKTLRWPANWMRTFSPQCGIALADLGGSGARDIILEGFGNGELLRYTNVSTNAKELRLKSSGPVFMGPRPFATVAEYWYFDFADADGDGIPDLIESNGGRAMFHEGTRGPIVSEAVATAEAIEPAVLILRNGPAAAECPRYDGNSAITLDAKKPAVVLTAQPIELQAYAVQPEIRAQKVALLRFTDLPPVPIRSVVLELSTDPCLQDNEFMLAMMISLPASCSAIDTSWDPLFATFDNAAQGQPWPANLLASGGTFQSILEPIFVQQRVQRLRWDVTRAVRAAQEQGRHEVDLLIRVEYTGPYGAGRGIRVCGPAWPIVDQRPKLIISPVAESTALRDAR